jgi:hypothetical protein
MSRHPSNRPQLEDTDPDFGLLKDLSAEYWPLIKGDKATKLPSIDDVYATMWQEAITQTRNGWVARREGWTAMVADIVRCTPAHLARKAGEGWEGDMDLVLHEMRSNRTRSASGAWATTELTDAERAELAELTRRSAAYRKSAGRADMLKKAMVAEAIRLIEDGRRRNVYGQTAAVARVTRWTREHCARLAPAVKKETTSKPGRRGQRRTPAAA